MTCLFSVMLHLWGSFISDRCMIILICSYTQILDVDTFFPHPNPLISTLCIRFEESAELTVDVYGHWIDLGDSWTNQKQAWSTRRLCQQVGDVHYRQPILMKSQMCTAPSDVSRAVARKQHEYESLAETHTLTHFPQSQPTYQREAPIEPCVHARACLCTE